MIPLFDTKSLGKFPFWVILIILINLYVFYLELIAPSPDIFITQHALISSRVNLADFTTLIPFISSQFLHGGFFHIISNMLFLWVFGRNVEARWGPLFPVLYLLSGMVGGLAQYLIDPLSNVPMLGASGAIAGVLGAYFAFFPHHRIKTLIFIFIFVTIIEVPAAIILLYWYITQLLSLSFSSIGQEGGGIAYTAHIAGFMAGWVISKAFYSRSTLYSFGINER